MSVRIINADVFAGLAQLADESVNCCVTSPPYWGLRDYGVEGQIGLEPTPEAFVAVMVEVFREVRRVLHLDGTLWLNLGDSYATRPNGSLGKTRLEGGSSAHDAYRRVHGLRSSSTPPGIKHKDLVGIPWMVAFALRADGWYLRQEIIWAKPNPMPESVTDRCTKAHEHLFLLAKGSSYFFDADAIREHSVSGDMRRPYAPGQVDKRGNGHDRGGGQLRKVKVPGGWDRGEGAHGTIHRNGRTSAEYQEIDPVSGRNKRSVWTIATQPYPDAHFATFPEALPETCIKAGCPAGGMVLDPFGSAGTTGLVADKLGRNAILIELNAEYAAMAERRIRGDCPMFAEVTAS
jgi:DNA modification methylase